MRFPFQTFATNRPVYPLGGIRVRHIPVFSVNVIGPLGNEMVDCRLDPGADDTIIPEWVAQRIGVDLTNAPWGESNPIAGTPLRYPCATVTLRLDDGRETCEWKAIVGFLNLPSVRWGLLGLTGFLQFFDTTLFGSRREVVLSPNTAFTGRHVKP
jgi:hypothetical protein